MKIWSNKMKVDKSDFKAYERKQKKEKNQVAAARAVVALRQAAVKSKWLLKDSKWDTYLTWIQADIDDLDAMMTSARLILEDPRVVNHDELMRAKNVLLEAKAMKQALNIAITYPSQMLKGKKDAKERQKDLNLDET